MTSSERHGRRHVGRHWLAVVVALSAWSAGTASAQPKGAVILGLAEGTVAIEELTLAYEGLTLFRPDGSASVQGPLAIPGEEFPFGDAVGRWTKVKGQPRLLFDLRARSQDGRFLVLTGALDEAGGQTLRGAISIAIHPSAAAMLSAATPVRTGQGEMSFRQWLCDLVCP